MLNTLPEVPVVKAHTLSDDSSVDTWSTPMSPSRKHGGLPSASLSSPGSPSSSVGGHSHVAAGLLPGGAGHALIEATAAWQDERLEQGSPTESGGKAQRQKSRRSTEASPATSDAEGDPKLRMPRPRAGNPLGSRPPAGTVGDSALPAQDDEERSPLRNLFFESALGGSDRGGNSPRRSPSPTSSASTTAGPSLAPADAAPSGWRSRVGGASHRSSTSSTVTVPPLPLPRSSNISFEGQEQQPEREQGAHQGRAPQPPPRRQAPRQAGKVGPPPSQAQAVSPAPGATAKDAEEANWVAGAQPHTVLGGARAEAV